MAETTTVSCPNCGQSFRVPNEKLGRTFKCTKCAQPFVAAAPGISATPAAAPAAPKLPPRPAAVAPPVMPQIEVEPETEAQDSSVSYASPTSDATKPKLSLAAVFSLIFSLSFCLFPLGLVFGFVGLSKTKNGRLRGRGLALAGTIISALMVPVAIVAALVVVPIFVKSHQFVNHFKSAENLKKIYTAMSTYGYEQKAYPPDLVTLAKVKNLSPALFVAPGTTDTPAASVDQIETPGHCSYTYIAKDVPVGVFGSLSGHYVLMYESGTDHPVGANILYDDGSVDTKMQAETDAAVAASKKSAADQIKAAAK